MMFDPMGGWNRPQGPQRGAGGVGAQGSGVFGQTLGAPQQGPQSGGGFQAPLDRSFDQSVAMPQQSPGAGPTQSELMQRQQSTALQQQPNPTVMPSQNELMQLRALEQGRMAPGRDVSGRGGGNPTWSDQQSAAMRNNMPQLGGGYGGPSQSAAMPFQGNPYGQMRPQQRHPMYGQMMARRLQGGGRMQRGLGQMMDF